MNAVHIVALVGGLVVLLGMVELLRRRQLHEKYAVLWLFVAIVVAILAIFPGLLDRVGRLLHIADPPNLLMLLSVIFLLLVSVHLSWESSRLEDETRSLAEEVALLRYQVEQSRIPERSTSPTDPGVTTGRGERPDA
jgi:hypothetical protein